MTRIENVLLRWGGKVMLLAIGVWVAAILGIFAGAWRLRANGSLNARPVNASACKQLVHVRCIQSVGIGNILIGEPLPVQRSIDMCQRARVFMATPASVLGKLQLLIHQTFGFVTVQLLAV